MSRLVDKTAAGRWEEGYPLGNGRLGAVIYGQADREEIQLNEDSVWYGKPIDRINPDAKEHLPEIRELILKGEIPEAEEKIMWYLSGTPQSERPYQSAGNLTLIWKGGESQKITEYERELDLSQAVAESFYKYESSLGTNKVKKEYLISWVDQVLAMHVETDAPEGLSCSALLTRARFYDQVKREGNDTILMYASCGEDGVNLVIALKAVPQGGKVETAGEHLLVTGAQSCDFYLAIETTFYQGEEGTLPGPDYGNAGSIPEGIIRELRSEKQEGFYIRRALRRVNEAAKKGYEAIRADHIRDHQQYFSRVSLSLEGKNQELLDYASTYFDYGRYLLICSSRAGTLPANLQGIWNKEMLPCWDSKYTININTEMNYWPVEICNLPEFHRPLFDLLKRMLARGKETARRMYGCRGFVAHHNTDIWGDCAPQDIWISAAYWVMGAAWLCTHVKMHYDYTRDLAFLQEMYPIVKEAALFFQDFLIEDQNEMVTCPSVSPENTYVMKNGKSGCICTGSTMDNQILRELFSFCKEAAEILQEDDEFTRKNQELLEKLPKTKIGKHGQIMEWREDYDEMEPGHRHISQLYGLHPSQQITIDGTPKLALAAQKTLERRLSYGGGHTGWSCAWIVNLYARLAKGEEAWENLKKLFEKSTFPNMMDNHPMLDYFVFQIDGNFGATAAMAEMLVQSNEKRCLLLPALPADWENGSIKGMVLHGGAVLDLSWEDRKLKSVKITSELSWSRRVHYQGQDLQVSLQPGESMSLDAMFVLN